TGRARVRAAVTTQLPCAGVQAGEFRRRSRATTAYTARRAATRRKGAWSPNASRRRSVVNAAIAVPPMPAPNTPIAVPRRCGGTAPAGPVHPGPRGPRGGGEPRVCRWHTDGEGGTADPEEETADEQGRQAAVDEPHEQGGGDRQRCHEREHGAAAEPVGERAH